MAESRPPEEDWRKPALAGLASIVDAEMPGFEVLLIDELAAYVMGAGQLEPPYTVEHGSRVVSALMGALVNSASFVPASVPEATPGIVLARTAFVQGAHDFAAKGSDGLIQLVNRLIPAVLGELEIYADAPENQTWSLFYFCLLAVASGPMNLLNPDAAEGITELFRAWDDVFGRGYLPPWRQAAHA